MRVTIHKMKHTKTWRALAAELLEDENRWRDLCLMNAALLVYKPDESPSTIGPDDLCPSKEVFVVRDVEIKE